MSGPIDPLAAFIGQCPCCGDARPLHPETGECSSCSAGMLPDRTRCETRGDFPWSDSNIYGLRKIEETKTRVCIGCGGDRFLVGSGSYRTTIKCPACGYEECIHDG